MFSVSGVAENQANLQNALRVYTKYPVFTYGLLSLYYTSKDKNALSPVVPIFVEHWGDNLQFYPNFALFSTLGE